MNKKLDLLAAGSWAIFDHLFEVEKIPQAGETVNILSPVAEADHIYWGGCSYNSAVMAARIGLRAGVLTVEGEDFVSRGYEKYLIEHDVDLSGLTILKGERSGHGFLFADTEGDGIVMGNLGAAWHQKDQIPDEKIIKSAKALLVAPTFDEFTLTAARIAKKHDVLTAVNGSLTTWPDYAEDFVRNTDILFINQFEYQQLADLLSLKSDRGIFDMGPQVLFVTRGDKGSRVITSEKEILIPAVPPEKFVDPVGAGDAFSGAVLSGILLGQRYEIAAKLGSTVASFVVEKKGSQTNLPDLNALKTRYESFFGESLPSLKKDLIHPMEAALG